MSLASCLLKHLAIVKLCGVPWADSTISRDDNRKPCYVPPPNLGKGCQFNVSHQAGIVTVVACSGVETNVGIDVVCVNERNDYAPIEREGFFDWVDMHADVFSDHEVESVKRDVTDFRLPDGSAVSPSSIRTLMECEHRCRTLSVSDTNGQAHQLDSNILIDFKHRRFYALWCLREAYVKMTSEALLAEWLKELEFRNVRAPDGASEAEPDDCSTLGEVVTDFEIFFKGQRVEDLGVELRAFGSRYMVATIAKAERSSEVVDAYPGFTALRLEEDIYVHAEG